MTRPVFYRPANGWVGDIIPFEQDGEFGLFYLHEVRATPKPGTPWNLVTTTDFVSFEERGVAIPSGGSAAGDFNAYTGSVVRDSVGIHHIFYTGHNPAIVNADGLAIQVVMHATSDDGMRTWVKHPEHTFGAFSGYETGDWRDPFVFFDDDLQTWRMLLAARHHGGPERRRGVIAECRSDDLISWSPTEPFWDPRRYVTHECPDVFKWGDWWYLVYSEFSESFTTRYRISRSPNGPWAVPPVDTIDGRAYYAAKTAERDGRRYFFGWIASKEDESDDGAWQWAGTMSVLESSQNTDGTLRFRIPEQITTSFDTDLPTLLASATPLTVGSPDGYSAVVSEEELPLQFLATVDFDIDEDLTECGVIVRASHDADHGYIVRMEPRRNRLVFDRWPRERTGNMQWQISGDVPFDVALERPHVMTAGGHRLEVIVDDDILVACLDHQTVLSARIYNRTHRHLAVFAGEGRAVITHATVRTRPDN
ncbi:family 43 glycosylhydrolase [uncultured Leifsonia sp.]|uniref:family 43 glycosylhydrolase n=1 Tax=uncultured Leifsonia sp. TaxID=340359 RepID=UPI0028D1C6BD|nr:family 43 glycosylhydrolase [uncultured Leifsonia sp.]